MRSPRTCRRCASGSVRNCDCGERLSPSWRGGRVELARLTARATAALGRAGWVRGRRRESIPGGLAAASMRRTLPRTQPARPLTASGGRPPRKKEGRAEAGRALRLLGAEHGSALQRAMQDQRKRTRRRPRPFSFPSVRQKPNALAHRHRETVGGGAVWVGRTVGAMDGAIEPPWVRALCLRSTASQAPERTAASGWAGLGVYGVSWQPTPPHPTSRKPEPLWLLTLTLTLTLPAAGGPPRVSAAPPHPVRSGSSPRCRQYRSSRSGSSPDTAGDSPRRSSTPAPGTRSRW